MDTEKYLFYFQRYVGHEQAGKFAAKTRALAQKRMEDLALAGGASTSWSEVSFLEAAIEALLECRRVLKHTYIYGFYLEDGSEKRLFEHLQELAETPLDKMDRGEVVNFTRVTSTFLRNLLEGIEAGLTM